MREAGNTNPEPLRGFMKRSRPACVKGYKSETIRWNRVLHPYELFLAAHKGFNFPKELK